MTDPIHVLLNGEPRPLAAGATIAALLDGEGLVQRRVAVEVNGEIVPIRDPQATAAALVACYERRLKIGPLDASGVGRALSFESFRERLLGHLSTLDAANA